jgi:hypothetical protein
MPPIDLEKIESLQASRTCRPNRLMALALARDKFFFFSLELDVSISLGIDDLLRTSNAFRLQLGLQLSSASDQLEKI